MAVPQGAAIVTSVTCGQARWDGKMKLRLMVESTRHAPKGWQAYATADEFIQAVNDADGCEIEAVAILGTIDECAAMLEATGNLVNRQFHLLGE